MHVIATYFRRTGYILAIVTSLCHSLPAQERSDTTRVKSDTGKARQVIEYIRNNRVSKRLLKSITRKNQSNPTAAVPSEEAFKPFAGKIIRQIEVRHIGFDKTVYDTTRSIKNTVTRISNALHSNSRDWVIKDNLFVRPNRPLNPYRLADNERYLRDLDFILDAKIYVVPLRHTSDSVDIIVLTRDVFSIGGSLHPSPTRTRFRLYDVNLGGWGQRLQFNGLYDDRRRPPFLYEALYRKNSIAGSFVNAAVGYTQMNTGSSYGDEEETAFYLRLDRPLVSPYTRFAGGIELSKNWSVNYFDTVDSLFRDYRYDIDDFWMGYNIGARSNGQDRSRHFVAVRAFNQRFTRPPDQEIEQHNAIYNDRSYVLGGLTFFKQNFYTASYIYGFGRTEDVPYGHNMSLYFGWTKELGYDRPYVGVEAEKSMVSRRNEFYTLGFRAGSYYNHGIEDGIMLLYGSLLSRLIPRGNLLIRQYFSAGYARVVNQKTSLPLDINNEFGLRQFSADSLRGTERFHFATETIAFTPLHFLGFRMAPFVSGEMALLATRSTSILHDKPYFGFGAGLRTRNENLVFGTIEFRLTYFPRAVEGVNTFSFSVSSNLRVKYTASFVKPPGFVHYN